MEGQLIEEGFTTGFLSLAKKNTRNKKICTPKAKKPYNFVGKLVLFEKYIQTGGDSNTYRGTISKPSLILIQISVVKQLANHERF